MYKKLGVPKILGRTLVEKRLPSLLILPRREKKRKYTKQTISVSAASPWEPVPQVLSPPQVEARHSLSRKEMISPPHYARQTKRGGGQCPAGRLGMAAPSAAM